MERQQCIIQKFILKFIQEACILTTEIYLFIYFLRLQLFIKEQNQLVQRLCLD